METDETDTDAENARQLEREMMQQKARDKPHLNRLTVRTSFHPAAFA